MIFATSSELKIVVQYILFFIIHKKHLILAHNSYIINKNEHLLNIAPLRVHLGSGWDLEPIY